MALNNENYHDHTSKYGPADFVIAGFFSLVSALAVGAGGGIVDANIGPYGVTDIRPEYRDDFVETAEMEKEIEAYKSAT